MDFNIPTEMKRETPYDAQVVYKKTSNEGMDGYLIYITYVNKDTGELFQVANLPSFAILHPTDWTKDYYYVEDIEIAVPSYVEPGEYHMLLSFSNKIKMRSLYLEDVVID